MPRKQHGTDIERTIKNSVVLPQRLDPHTTAEQYRTQVTREIMLLVNKGESPDRAFHIVTGKKLAHTISAKPSKGRHRKKKDKKRGITVAASAMAIAVSVVGVGGMLTFQSTVGTENALAVARSTFSDIGDIEGDKNILVVGMDTRPEKDQGSGSFRDIPGHRTDTIAVVHVSDGGSSIDAVSIPRDTQIDTSVCSDTYSGYNDGQSQQMKINGIYDEYGQECLENSVSAFTGVSIDSYVEVNFESFVTLVDTIGGVDITTKNAVVDDTLGVIIPHAGTHHMNGAQLLDYSRARKVEGTAKSDFDRITRQQEVANKIISKIDSLSAVDKFRMVKDIHTRLSPYINVENISAQDMMSLAKAMLNQDSGNIGTQTIPITGETGEGNLIADTDGVHSMFENIEGKG